MPNQFKPLAIVGVSALFPGSTDAHGFWRDIVAGRDLITDVPARRWLIEDHYDPDPRTPDKTYCKRGSFLSDVDFDPIEFGVPPTALSATDSCQLLALMVAKQVLEDALTGQFQEINRERASVILGVTSGQELFLEVASRLQSPVWVKALRECGISEDKVQEIRARASESYVPWQENTFPGLLGNVVAGRIANRFDLGGTNCVTDAACASSLSALSMASAELQLGHSDLVITGGADTFNDISMFVCFSKTPALSPTGDCRPFSDHADGTVLGEGLAMFALKRLDDAERDGNRVYAVIRGIGSSSDGRSKSIYAPSPRGQAKAMQRAYEIAGYGPDTVELVEAHGTGTAAGDAAEISSLNSVFQPGVNSSQPWCAVGSIKSQIGHTKAAAGSAGLFKAVMALQHRVLPGTIKVNRPNPGIDIERGAFYINTRTRPWIRGGDHPRRASLSSFGFGGTNFHVTLEEYVGSSRPDQKWTSSSELVLICAATESDLASACRKLAGDAANQTLAEIALAGQLAYDHRASQRLAFVCESNDDLIRKLERVVQGSGPAPGVYRGVGEKSGKTAFLFPGQGSQYLGMTADVAMAFEDSLRVWDRESAAALLVFPQPTFSEAARAAQLARLTATENAQPAIGAASAALLAVLRKLGVTPDCIGGHSFGEITALFGAGAISFETMQQIARRRGELMAGSPAETGAMLSVALDTDEVERRLDKWRLPIAVANQNSPRQTVLSGPVAGIEEATRRFSNEKIETTRLPVSTAFHSPLMSGVIAPFQAFLEGCEIGSWTVPVYSNLDGTVLPCNGASVRQRLARQITLPVRFRAMVETMYEDGVRTFIEVGPGSVLTPLVGAILGSRPHNVIPLDRQRSPGLLPLWRGLGQMAAQGFPLDWAPLRARQEVEVAQPKEPGRFLVPISGGNYGRPYPPAGGAASLPKPVLVQSEVQHPAQSKANPAAPVAAPASGDAIQAYKVFQESIAEAHANWQSNLAKGHESFLRAMETAYMSTVAGSPVPAPNIPRAAEPSPQASHGVTHANPVPVAVIAARPAAAPQTAPSAGARLDAQKLLWNLIAETTGYPVEMLTPELELEADLGIDPIQGVEIFSTLRQQLPHRPEFDQTRIGEFRSLGDMVQQLQADSTVISAHPAAEAVLPDLSSVLMGLIVEKTGYPVEMLRRDMSLEADLGIDSIKRVEIFSALQDAVPGLPLFDTAALGQLSTIADVLTFIASGKNHAQTDKAEPAPASAASADLSSLLLDLVAEKTGYPVEMLRQDMSLEADLGIDSIKRVEIFSALQDAVPGLPLFDTAALGQLSTISDVIAFIGGTSGAKSAIQPTVVQEVELPTVSRRRNVAAAERAPSGHVTLDPSDGPVWIRNDGVLAPLLAELLRGRGYDAQAVDSIPADAAAIIWVTDLQLSQTDDEALEMNVHALGAARLVAARLANSGGVFVTVRSTANPWSGGLSGLAKTAALEWPKARVKAIDIATGSWTNREIAAAIVQELTSGGPEVEITLAAGSRRTTPIAIPTPRFTAAGLKRILNPDSVLAVSGGARGVTAQCMIELARRTQCKMVVLGRTNPDAAEVLESVRLLTAAGSRVRYAQVDIRNANAVSAALSSVRQQWGPITGIIHGAGVLADRRIENLSADEFQSVFSTKVEGLRALLCATHEDPLSVICVFSSVAARCGNPGQAAYAMANEAMNRAAHLEAERRGRQTKVKVIDWGPWSGGMVTPSLKRRFESLGVNLLGLQEGAAYFADEVNGERDSDVEVVLGDLPPSPPRELRVRIREASHPFLADHRIQDVPVLPVVEALELFLRCALAQPDAPERLVCTGLKVLRGVKLDRFYSEGNLLLVRPRSKGIFELTSSDGLLHYEATLLPEEAIKNDTVRPQPLSALAIAPWSDEDVYGKLLFHGPAFQVIQSVAGVSKTGILGTVTGTSERQWQDGFRHSDAALLDGGLQLARLWGFHTLGKLTLPTKIGRAEISAVDASEGPVKCEVTGTTIGDSGIRCDVAFRSPEGGLLASMTGVEMFAAPAK